MSRSGLGSPEVWEREIGKRGGVHASRRRLFVTYVHSVLAFRSSGSTVITEFPHSNSCHLAAQLSMSQHRKHTPDGSWKWTQRAPGEERWIKNHIKGVLFRVLFQKGKAESALSPAESAPQAALARHHETNPHEDPRAPTEAAKDSKEKTTNPERQPPKT